MFQVLKTFPSVLPHPARVRHPFPHLDAIDALLRNLSRAGRRILRREFVHRSDACPMRLGFMRKRTIITRPCQMKVLVLLQAWTVLNRLILLHGPSVLNGMSE